MQAVVDSLLTTYDRQGKGKVALLLHGWGDSMTTYDMLSPTLAKSFEVIRLDLPGFGQSQAPPKTWNLDNYAKFVHDFLAKLEIRHVAVIIGHSNGGALAIRGLAEGTLAADRLILLAASGIRPRRTFKRFGLRVIAKVGKVATFWLPYQKRQALRKKLYGVAGSDMLIAPHLQETFKKTVRQDVQADAAKLKLPTLLIFGSGDRAIPVSDGERYAKLMPNAKLVVLDKAGHFVHQDQTLTVIKLVEEFLT